MKSFYEARAIDVAGDEQWRICVTRGVRMHRAIYIVLEIPCRETQIEIYLDPFGVQL